MKDMGRRRLAIFGVALALGILLTTVSFPGCQRSSAVVVDFPDPALDSTIREMIGKLWGDIHSTDLSKTTSLLAPGRNINTLDGIDHCIDLTELDLSGNQIVIVNPLSRLTKLTWLNLASPWLDGKIVDISPLSQLTKLTELGLGGNQIVDISPLSRLTKLTWLSLYGNQIVDISPLSRLTKLTWLSLYGNQIVDISPLSGLTNLENLGLENNQISNIQALVDNSELGRGDMVDLRNNYLDLTLGSPDMLNIEALQDRGVDVEYLPQE